MNHTINNILFLRKIVIPLVIFWGTANGFSPFTTRSVVSSRELLSSQNDACFTKSSLSMGLFDGITKAFSNTEYGPPPEKVSATARHILVKSKPEAKKVLKMITSGESSFEECARNFSTCSSSRQGGSLGSFSPGTMVPQFDKAVFNPDTKVGQVIGPIATDFGFHLIVVEKRAGGSDWY